MILSETTRWTILSALHLAEEEYDKLAKTNEALELAPRVREQFASQARAAREAYELIEQAEEINLKFGS